MPVTDPGAAVEIDEIIRKQIAEEVPVLRKKCVFLVSRQRRESLCLHARGCKTDEQNNSEGFPRYGAQLSQNHWRL
jgi:hypothetical protein